MNFTADEKLLSQKPESEVDTEAKWDAKAAQYNKSQKRQGLKDSYDVAELLHLKNQLIHGEVLDVGGGAGLYAIPFASYAKHVTITDISSNMLSFAKENAAEAGIHNLEYVKLDWEKASLKELDWEHHFDLVYASMCPAVKDGETLDKMIAASKKWCCVNRYIKMTDSLAETIENQLNYAEEFDPHNNRNRVQGIFNYLWEKGYEPEIEYYEETTEKLYTVDEAVKHYSKRFAEIAQKQNLDLEKIITDLAENNRLKVTKYKKLALVSWQV